MKPLADSDNWDKNENTNCKVPHQSLSPQTCKTENKENSDIWVY